MDGQSAIIPSFGGSWRNELRHSRTNELYQAYEQIMSRARHTWTTLKRHRYRRPCSWPFSPLLWGRFLIWFMLQPNHQISTIFLQNYLVCVSVDPNYGSLACPDKGILSKTWRCSTTEMTKLVPISRASENCLPCRHSSSESASLSPPSLSSPPSPLQDIFPQCVKRFQSDLSIISIEYHIVNAAYTMRFFSITKQFLVSPLSKWCPTRNYCKYEYWLAAHGADWGLKSDEQTKTPDSGVRSSPTEQGRFRLEPNTAAVATI